MPDDEDPQRGPRSQDAVRRYLSGDGEHIGSFLSDSSRESLNKIGRDLAAAGQVHGKLPQPVTIPLGHIPPNPIHATNKALAELIEVSKAEVELARDRARIADANNAAAEDRERRMLGLTKFGVVLSGIAAVSGIVAILIAVL